MPDDLLVERIMMGIHIMREATAVME